MQKRFTKAQGPRRSMCHSTPEPQLGSGRIPEDKEDWMSFMVENVKQKTQLDYMTDKHIARAIEQARKVLFVPKVAKIDPDMPDIYYWNEGQVADWMGSLGFNDVQKMFLNNHISGRRLITVDASALNQMGLTDLSRMREVTKLIRERLGIPAPNALRAIMRLVPFELFLKRNTNAQTFQEFCKTHGFPYDIVKSNKCAQIPATCKVQVKPVCRENVEQGHFCGSKYDSSDDESHNGSDNSLKSTPTVEEIVRNLPFRDKLIKQVEDEIIRMVLDCVARHGAEALSKGNDVVMDNVILKTSGSIEIRVRNIFEKAFASLRIKDKELSQDRVEFVASVAQELVDDVLRTREILADMEKFKSYMENSLDPQTMKKSLGIATDFLEDISSISTLLTLGQLELEAIIKEAPGLQHFVDDIVASAQNKVDSKSEDVK